LIYQKEIRFHYETLSKLADNFLGYRNGVTLKYDLANLVLFIFIYMNLHVQVFPHMNKFTFSMAKLKSQAHSSGFKGGLVKKTM
jgi:hypothetical protein